MADQKVKYRLTYFDLRGRAELIRMIFHFAKVDFEDVRIPVTEWANRKDDFPRKKVPLLEIIDESTGSHEYLTESLTIARFLSNRFGLVGENELERAQCDEVIDSLIETWYTSGYCFYEKEEARKAILEEKLLNVEIPRLLGHLERKLEANGGEHMVGNKMTWADIATSVILHHLTQYAASTTEKIEKLCPKMKQLATKIESVDSIKSWIERRPVTVR